MTETFGFLSADGASDAGRAPIPREESDRLGLSVVRDGDGNVVAERLAPAAPQLYVAPLADGVLWGSDLRALVRERAARGVLPAARHATVLAYLRGDEVASGSATFYEGIQRLDAGDRVTIRRDGTVQRERGDEPPVDDPSAMADAVAAAVGRATGAAATGAAVPMTVLVAEDFGSAALLATADASRAVTVHAASARSADGGAVNGSRAIAAVGACDGVEHAPVRPSTEQFKKDLADLVRVQAEPFSGLGVYAHYCAMRKAAADAHGTVVLDATGPIGTGFISAAYLPPATPPAEQHGRLSRVRERVRGRRRRELDVDAILDGQFLAGTAPSGHRPAQQREDRDTAAVVAARRNAARFGVQLELPLLDPDVRAAQRQLRREGADPLAALGGLTHSSVASTVPERPVSIDLGEWTSRLKGMLHQAFRSEQFARRPWTDQRAVLEAFEAYIAGRTEGGAEVFWRLFLLEMWMREYVDPRPPASGSAGEVADHAADAATGTTAAGTVAASTAADGVTGPSGSASAAGSAAEGHVGAVGSGAASAAASPSAAAPGDTEDEHGRFDEPSPKEPLTPNAGKQLDLELPDGEGGGIARRYPIRTRKFAADSDMDAEITGYIAGFFAALDEALAGDGPGAEDHRQATVGRSWTLTVSEKIIAIMQGRSYFVWDVQTGWWANTLSRYVSRTPAGIGLGDPVTMQLAIQEAGLPRVLAASAAGVAGKVAGRRGLFYQLVGGNVRAIDGPTEYSVYPANVSAKLPPKDPDKVAAHLNEVIREAVPEAWRPTFDGTVVMDANDIGRNTLGKAAPLSGEHYELQFADNPLGQGREQTPMAVVFER